MRKELTTNKSQQMQVVHKLAMTLEIFDSPTAREATSIELDSVLIQSIVKANNDLGYNANDEKLAHIYESIADEVRKAVPNVRLAEIPIAIGKGILGDFGDFHGLSVVSVIKFIKAHLASRERSDLAKQRNDSESDKKPPTEEEILSKDKELIIIAFEKFKKDGFYNDLGNYIYKVMDQKFKVIPFTKDVRWEFVYEGIQEVLKQKQNESIINLNSRTATVNEIKFISSILSLYENINDKAKNVVNSIPDELLHLKAMILSEAQKKALHRFFSDCVKMEVDIKDLIADD